MKKLKIFLISIFAMLIFIPNASAASVNASITSTSQAVVGNKVTVTVTLSSSSGIGSWQMNLNYDKSYLQLTSSSAEAGGNMMAGYASSNSGIKKKTYTFTFRTLKTGSTKLSITSALVYGSDMNQMNLSSGSKTIKIITQKELEASYSKDNNLKSLTLTGFEISPEFNKDTLTYNAVVPENTKEVEIKAAALDSRSTISGTGTKEVTSGTNSFEIVVKAQNGSEKTYTLNVEVKDNNPINVTVDSNNYTVVKIKEYLPETLYEEKTVKIGEFDIPAYYNDTIKKTLVGLKDSTGNISLFIYDDGKYEKYNELKFNEITIYPLALEENLAYYEQGEITLNGITTPAFYKEKNSRYAIIYGINLNNGEKSFYKVDKTTGSAIVFDEEEFNNLLDYQRKMNLYSYIIIGFSVILVIMFILLITKKNKKKKVKKDKIPEKLATREENQIIETTPNVDEKIYDNKDTKKKKNKK